MPLTRLHAVATAPIFSSDESFFGSAIVGGPLLLAAGTGRHDGRRCQALRRGKAGRNQPPPVQFASPVFDWREMQRWGISESRLPPGSEILFRNPTVWDQYKWYIMLVAAIVLAQTALIVGLLYQHRRREPLRRNSLRRVNELARMNRIANGQSIVGFVCSRIKAALGNDCSIRHRWPALACAAGARC